MKVVKEKIKPYLNFQYKSGQLSSEQWMQKEYVVSTWKIQLTERMSETDVT